MSGEGKETARGAASAAPSLAAVQPDPKSSAGAQGGGAAPGGGGGGAKGGTSKAERRAIQEAQRAAKAASKGTAPGGKGASKPQPPQQTGEKKGAVPQGKVASTDGKENARGTAGGGGKDPGRGVSTSGTGGGGKKEKDAVMSTRPSLDGAAAKSQLPQQQQEQLPGLRPGNHSGVDQQAERKTHVDIFRHLPRHVASAELLPKLEANFLAHEATKPHPAVYQVGLLLLAGDLVDGNASCAAMLGAFRTLITDYVTPPEKTLVRDLTAKLEVQVTFLKACRQLAVGMGNAIRVLKQQVAQLASDVAEAEAKASLVEEIDRFLQEKIHYADHLIVQYALQKIRREGDVLLVFGCTPVVEDILLAARKQRFVFRVVVVDSRPKLEAKGLLRRLVKRGVACTYLQLNALSTVMPGVTRVLLGAEAVMANGFLYAVAGSASVAMLAHSCHVPVLVCCETYKFHERVQLDSITVNELGDPAEVASVAGREKGELDAWVETERLHLLNLKYDIMPSEFVSAIVSEGGLMPPSRVPVVLREGRKGYLGG
eukprot:TRINITY_DN1357_c0_g1_i2.p1 TRINITY_DN1357_c0_g1~~TRINITY_DN1357_c0_g1_i2.p1  ORF type:complete len:542 (-),score=131.74 TRINITY_DN1357_c0_g1_i2:672-2297(-)